MADIVKLKKKATDFEAKKQMDKALATYRDIIEAYEAGEEDPIDIPLYNRVGDLLQKAGNLPEAVTVWEKAVDHYSEGGFYNPAIALCNKILRASPGRTVIYYKLGKISAEKGFKADARQNFLEYASRQQKAGKLDDAFRALKEFADLVPGQHDVRLMLADQLVKAGRKDEAIEQLQLGYGQASSDGDTAAGDEFVAKMKAIDPTVEPRTDAGGSAGGAGGLVFLDVDSPGGGPKTRRPTGDLKRVTKAVAGLALLEPAPEPAVAKPPVAPAAAKPSAPPAARPSAPVTAKPPAAPPAARPSAPAAAKPAAAKPPVAKPPAAPAEPIAPAASLDIVSTDMGAGTAPPPRTSVIGLEVTRVGDEAEAPAEEIPIVEMEDTAAADSMIELEPTFDTGEGLPLVEVEPSMSFADGAVEAPMLTDDPSAGDLPLLEPEPSFAEEEPAPAEEPLVAEMSTELASSVDELRERVAAAEEDWALRRQLAEALLDAGDRTDGLAELEAAMAGYERDGDLDTAGSIAEEIVRLEPRSIRFHQKRVEFAFRANDRGRLAEAYVELADALLADGQATKARAVYQRVLDIRPDDLRAQAAIESIPEEAEEAAPPPRRSTVAHPKVVPPPKTAAKKGDGDDDFVSLGDWLREDDEPKSLRMVVEEKEPTGDEQADFDDMLRAFKQGVSDNVDDEDHEAHYDLGVAYKEMGLLDEAIAEFQKALRGTKDRVRAFEALGHCFIEKEQLPVASTILQRALSEPGVRDEALIGVLYLLGAIAEQLGSFADAKKHYERVFAVDIQFRDIGDRLNAVEQQLT